MSHLMLQVWGLGSENRGPVPKGVRVCWGNARSPTRLLQATSVSSGRAECRLWSPRLLGSSLLNILFWVTRADQLIPLHLSFPVCKHFLSHRIVAL